MRPSPSGLTSTMSPWPMPVSLRTWAGIFFFQAEDGIRCRNVTGVQTCALPICTVYIHALVRDDKGQKMSKSLGNVVDPIELIDKFGADALRFTLAAMAAQGRDIKLSTSRIEGYRNFGTKLWNAARFCEMQNCVREPDFIASDCRSMLNRWIVGEVAMTARAVSTGITGHRYNEAAGALYQFVWNIYCDWYLELIKPVLSGADMEAGEETRRTAA